MPLVPQHPNQLRLWLFCLALLILAPAMAHAVPVRYFDVWPGGRAAQMGGAFTAVADDPTAAYYNPAGLAQLEKPTFSLSANAFELQSLTIKNRLFGHDLEITGETFFPSSWAAVKRVRNAWAGVSVIVPANTHFDSTNRFGGVTAVGFVWDSIIADFSGKQEVYMIGPSVAFEPYSGLMVGLTAYYWYEKFQLDQTVYFGIQTPTIQLEELKRRDTTTHGGFGQVGLLYRPSDIYAVGFVIRTPAFLRQEIDYQDRSYLFDGVTGSFTRTFTEGTRKESARRPLGMTAGVSFRPWPGTTLSADLSYHHSGDFADFTHQVEFDPVFNGALGVEQLITPRIPIRRTAAPVLNPQPVEQADHVDFYGISIGTGLIDEIARLDFGFKFTYGFGESKDANTGLRYRVKATAYTFFVSGGFHF